MAAAAVGMSADAAPIAKSLNTRGPGDGRVDRKGEPPRMAAVLVEAESLNDAGGWVRDTQFIDQMGSPFLLAHGMGVPVKDASADIMLPEPGKYRVWVRTRDWVGNWGAPGAPGRFQVLIDGCALKATFGVGGAGAWHWQDGGQIETQKKQVTLTLHDLTGFDGRCDAIFLTADLASCPPNSEPEMYDWRRKLLGLPEEPSDAGDFDLVVVGGGLSGCCAAISAARLGAKVALVQDRPVLGGNNSSEIRQGLMGKLNQAPYPRLGDVVKELNPYMLDENVKADFDDNRKRRVVEGEKNIRLFLNTYVSIVEMDGGSIRAVIGRDTVTGREIRFPARCFADCTGDGTVGWAAGADFRIGREGRGETGEPEWFRKAYGGPIKPDSVTMGATFKWTSTAEKSPCSFPVCPWAVQFNEENYQNVTSGDWNWEFGFGKDQIEDFEQIRDYALRVIYGNWAYLKNHSSAKAKFANLRLDRVAYIGGKRESRRLVGDVFLTAQDFLRKTPYPDACVSPWHTFDVHLIDPQNARQFPGGEFRSRARGGGSYPYAIPYRCFYSRNISNLFMAGRDISVSHMALGSVRLMTTCGMMGEVVGMAASLCKKHETTPRGVYEKHLDELKTHMTCGVGRDRLRTREGLKGN